MEELQNTQESQNANPQTNYTEYFESHRQAWNDCIKQLSAKLKNLEDLSELQSVVFAKRQDALDYYHTMLNQLAYVDKEYKKKRAAEYNKLKTNSQIRYTTEAAINTQLDSNLAESIYFITLLNNHVTYMKDIVKELIDLDFAIGKRINIQYLITGGSKL